MKSRRYVVKLTGETPLLMHQDNLGWSDSMKKWQNDPANRKKSIAGDDRSPAWTWMGSLYVDQGKVCIPSDNLMTMLREGGTKCPTGKKQGTFKALTQSGIVVDQSSWPLISAKGEVHFSKMESLIEEEDFEKHEELVKGLGFSLFVKRAKIGKSKHVRVRPRFDAWECEGTLTVFEDTITTPALVNILNHGGAYCGLCDWRMSSPTKPGQFGKFTAEVKEI